MCLPQEDARSNPLEAGLHQAPRDAAITARRYSASYTYKRDCEGHVQERCKLHARLASYGPVQQRDVSGFPQMEAGNKSTREMHDLANLPKCKWVAASGDLTKQGWRIPCKLW